MPVHSVEVSVPDTSPFDRQESWFESYVGSVISPVVQSQPVTRFWFTRYGAVEHGKTSLFRFETEDVGAVLDSLSAQLARFQMTIKNDGPYDVAGDIGRGERSRFLGSNSKHQSDAQRGEVAFTFLHASACLMLDCLVGPDCDGYYSLESETQSGFNRESSLEQYLHLFCNMTCVPTYLAIGLPPGSPEPIPLSYEELKRFSNQAGWRFRALREAMF
jgi:hypothetical protein